MKVGLYVIVGLILVAMLGFAATGYDFAMFKFWAPKYEDARRNVFENTQSFVQGKRDYLSRLRLEYQSAADGPQKQALRELIISEAAQIDNDKLPNDLSAFVRQLESQ